MDEKEFTITVPLSEFQASTVQPPNVDDGVVRGNIFGIEPADDVSGALVPESEADKRGVTSKVDKTSATFKVVSCIVIIIALLVILAKVGVGRPLFVALMKKNIPVISAIAGKLARMDTLLHRNRNDVVIEDSAGAMINASYLYDYFLLYDKIKINGVLTQISDYDFYAVPTFKIDGRRYYVRKLLLTGGYEAICDETLDTVVFELMTPLEIGLLAVKEDIHQ